MKKQNRVNGLLRYVCICIGVCMGINMYAHDAHYGKLQLTPSPTAGGLVYASTSETSQVGGYWSSAGNSVTTPELDCGGQGWPNRDGDDAKKQTYYGWVKVNDGYYFMGWSETTDGSILPNSNLTDKGYLITLGIDANNTDKNKVTMTRYARFSPVTFNDAGPFEIAPTALKTSKPWTVRIPTTGGDALADFDINARKIESAVGDGEWAITGWDFEGTELLVSGTYITNRNTLKNSDNTRADKATLSLKSKAADQAVKEYTLLATFGMTIATPSSLPSSLAINYLNKEATGTVAFDVTGVETESDVMATIAAAGTDEMWEIVSTTYADNKVTVTYKCTIGENSTHGEKMATISLTSNYVDAPASASCDVKAMVTATLVKAECDQIVTTPDITTVEGYVAIFTAAHASSTADFVLPATLTEETTGSTWTLGATDAYIYTAGAYPLSTLTIPYTFTHTGVVGDYFATLTLQTKDGSSKEVRLKAIVEAVAEHDAEVITADGVTTQYATWAEAFAAANVADGNTLRLLRNIDLGELTAHYTITKTMTLDFYGNILTAALATDYPQLLVVDAAGKTLTMTDSRSGGAMRVTSAGSVNNQSAVQVRQGSLVLEKGNVEATYTTTSANTFSGVYLATADATFTMNGGTLVATHTAGEGVCGMEAVAGSGVTINAGTIRATANTKAYAIHSFGSVNVTGGTLEAEANGESAYSIYMDVIDNADRALYTMGGIYKATAGASDAVGIYVPKGATTDVDNAEAYPQVVLNKPTVVVTAGTSNAYGIRTGGKTVIDDGAFIVNVGTTEAQGCYVESGDVTATNTIFTVTAAMGKAYGLTAEASISSNLQKAECPAITLNNVTITATTTTGDAAYGIYTKGTTSGEKVAFPTVNIQGGKYVAKAASNTARGIYMDNTQVGATGQASAGSVLTVRNATIEATTQTGATVDGIRTSGPTEIDNCKITATAATTTVKGLHVYDNKTKLTNSTITVSGTGTTSADNGVYGVYLCAAISTTAGIAGWNYVGELVSENNTVTVTTNGDVAYGLYLNAFATTTNNAPAGDYATAASAVLKSDTYTATATGKIAYAVGMQAPQTSKTATTAPTCTIHSGKFHGSAPTEGADVDANGVAGNVVIENGYFVSNANVEKYLATGKILLNLPATTDEAKAGYNYYVAKAAASKVAVCKIGSTEYTTLEEALSVVNSSTATATIVMINNYTLPAGNYMLPANATLLVPYNASQTTIKGTSPDWAKDKPDPYEYLRLTFASGVNLTVYGKIEASAELSAYSEEYATSNTVVPGTPAAAYGHLQVSENARVDVESGAIVYAWGYITGKGLINAKSGSDVYEPLQLGDWKGGTLTSNMNSKKWAFPVTHYFYQNIECPIIYRPGARALAKTAVVISNRLYSYVTETDNMLIVGSKGSGALFLMDAAAGEDTWLRKAYDPTTDRTDWIVNSDMQLGGLTVSLSGYSMDSKNFLLPLSSNMTITLNSGIFEQTQNAYIMPGTVININKEATLQINSGKSLYVVDRDQWGTAPAVSYRGAYSWPAFYSPSWTTTTSPRSMGQKDDAEIFVHGTIDVQGSLLTTAGGGNIHSTNEDAGKVIFRTTPATSYTPFYQANSSDSHTYMESSVTSAQLKNGGTTFTQTTGATAGQSFNYINNEWVSLTEGCLSEKEDGSGTHYYAHPSDVVEVNAGNTDHTYSDVAGEGRLFINTEGKTSDGSCVWWEVEQDANGYYANNPNYANYEGYYAYDSGTDYWKPVTVKVTWVSEGNILATYDQHKGTSPFFVEAMPTKSGHVWKGWTDGTTFYDRNEQLPKAMEAVTYTAEFESNEMYKIVFEDADGSLLDAGLYKKGTTPICSVTPEPILTVSTIQTFKGWYPAVEPVSKSVTYTAIYNDPTKRLYPIHFLNYDGTELYTEEFAHNTMPIYDRITPTREGNSAYSYEFSGWQSSTGANGLAAVSGEEWYTAQFTTIEREYGDYLDVVDASSGNLVLNMNGYSSASAGAGWTISVGDNNYDKDNRAADRTLTIALPTGIQADDKVLIVAKGKDGVVESRHRYTVPHLYTSNATLGTVAGDYSSVVYVQGGTLTIAKDATLQAIYVAAGAELKINAGVTLAVDKLVLRTTAFASAVLTDAGTLKANKVYYSRIVSDKSQAYPIALPFDVDLSNVTFSNGKPAIVGTHFGLLWYDSQQRANQGLSTTNWQTVRIAEHPILQAQRGYQLLSASAYYSEYYFPVSYTPDGADATVAVGAYAGTAEKGHWGFNTVCSPYTSRYTCTYTDPADAVKISILNTDNKTYTQKPAVTIEPALMWFYQAAADGVLSFGTSAFNFVAGSSIQRAASNVQRSTSSVLQQTQWIQLLCGTEMEQTDETNIYLHPDRFSAEYDLGYDVQKLSTSGTLPFVWTSVAYGNLAFAALPDSIAVQGIALSLYAPAAGEMYLTVQDNNYMSRLEHLYLVDRMENAQVDLLEDNYVWFADAGTSTGRFYLYPILRTTSQGDVATDISSSTDARQWVAYSVEKNVIVEQLPTGCYVRCFDMSGKLVASCIAHTEQVIIAVPTSGMYFVHTESGAQKVIVNK